MVRVLQVLGRREFQQFFLNGRDTVLENVALPLRIRGASNAAIERSAALLGGRLDDGEQATRDGIQIGFKVETASEVDAWAQELGRRGFALVAPPSGDRYEGTRSFRLADPDGRQVAVFYDYPR